MTMKTYRCEIEQLGNAWIARVNEKNVAAGTLKQAMEGLRLYLAAQLDMEPEQVVGATNA